MVRIKTGPSKTDYVDYCGAGRLDLGGTLVASLPDDLKVNGSLDLSNCKFLRHLPIGLDVDGDIDLSGCIALEAFPECKISRNIDLSVCVSLKSLSADTLTVMGSLYLHRCTSLRSLPKTLEVVGNCWLNYCNIRELPENLVVHGKLDMYGCNLIEKLPPNMDAKRAFITTCPRLAIDFPNCVYSYFEVHENTKMHMVGYLAEEIGEWCAENEVEIHEKIFDVKPYPIRCHVIDDPAQLAYYRLRWG